MGLMRMFGSSCACLGFRFWGGAHVCAGAHSFAWAPQIESGAHAVLIHLLGTTDSVMCMLGLMRSLGHHRLSRASVPTSPTWSFRSRLVSPARIFVPLPVPCHPFRILLASPYPACLCKLLVLPPESSLSSRPWCTPPGSTWAQATDAAPGH